jgi:hypothetical protein
VPLLRLGGLGVFCLFLPSCSSSSWVRCSGSASLWLLSFSSIVHGRGRAVSFFLPLYSLSLLSVLILYLPLVKSDVGLFYSVFESCPCDILMYFCPEFLDLAQWFSVYVLSSTFPSAILSVFVNSRALTYQG